MKLTQGEKSGRSRGLILEAALQLFSKQGYRGTSIREIAEAALQHFEPAVVGGGEIAGDGNGADGAGGE